MNKQNLEMQILKIKCDLDSGRTDKDFSKTELGAVLETLSALTSGALRVSEKVNGEWITHAWVKQAILLYFRFTPQEEMASGVFQYHDKVAIKKWTPADQVRSVPGSIVRFGAFVEPGCILMPSFVNIGAYVGSGTMVDTWATVGSCAQVGKNVHLSGGVGLGGVLEPVQASPVVIEDHVFVGSRAIIVEGIRVEENAVIGAGVTLTESTKIIDLRGTQVQEVKGFIPRNCVVIPGTLPKEKNGFHYGVPCALIVGERKVSTDRKTSLNGALREFNVSV
jgi:2,3,4,5-tetrahydropyridine-2-carboxylate N-succinyltransferase